MKREKFIPVFFISVALFLISFVMGYQLMEQNVLFSEKKKIEEKQITERDTHEVEILKEEKRISPNTFIEERINYASCGHVITKIKKVSEEQVNMNRAQFEEYMHENFPNQRIVSFSPSRIAIGINKNHLCENHYVIRESQGKIAIFSIDEDGQRILDKVFNDYPISLLMEVDQQKLKEGIIVDSQEELSDVLQNFIS